MKPILLLLISIVASVALGTPVTKLVEGKNLLTDAKVSIDSATKKGMVVVFLSAKCPCSNSHIVELRNLAEEFKDFSFVGIHSNVDEDANLSKPYFQNAGLPFPVIEDEKAKLADQFQALKTPHSYVFSPTGEVLYQGGVSNSKDCTKADRKFLRDALDDIQAGKAVRMPLGRTLGCAISRGEKNVW